MTKPSAFDDLPFPDTTFGMGDLSFLAPLTGLQQLQSVIENQQPAPAIAETMQQWISLLEEGEVEFRGNPDARYLNPLGSVHGGWAMTLLDSVLGCAVHTTMAVSETYSSLGTEVKFIRPIFPNTGQVRAVGKVLSRGRRTATASGHIEDQKGRILATGTTTCFIQKIG